MHNIYDLILDELKLHQQDEDRDEHYEIDIWTKIHDNISTTFLTYYIKLKFISYFRNMAEQELEYINDLLTTFIKTV